MDGYSRRDPLSGDMHHYSNGQWVGYSRENPLTGDLDHFQVDPVAGPGPVYVSPLPETSDRVWLALCGLIPAAWVFITAGLFWISHWISGASVFVYSILAYVTYRVGGLVWKRPVLWVFLSGGAVIGLMVLGSDVS